MLEITRLMPLDLRHRESGCSRWNCRHLRPALFGAAQLSRATTTCPCDDDIAYGQGPSPPLYFSSFAFVLLTPLSRILWIQCTRDSHPHPFVQLTLSQVSARTRSSCPALLLARLFPASDSAAANVRERKSPWLQQATNFKECQEEVHTILFVEFVSVHVFNSPAFV
jgi:hypothetical protein